MEKSKNPTVKILVAYHKPATLLKSEILTPIHAGRALKKAESKDGVLNDADLKWLEENMIGDDTGENISHLNRKTSEVSATYWAWKNYDKLGNPDYIGFAHYRRHFNFNETYGAQVYNFITKDYFEETGLKDEVILEKIKDYDIVLPAKWNLGETIKKQFEYNHGVENYKITMDVLLKFHPEYKKAAELYNNSESGYFVNMFIMKKELFFEYSNWIFPIFEECEKQGLSTQGFQDKRIIGAISERLFGIWVTHLKLTNKKIKFKEYQTTFIKNTNILEKISPSFENEVSICTTADNNYIPYCAVTIKSLIENTSKENNYCIYILHCEEIKKTFQKRILKMQTPNCKIRFVDAAPCFSKINKSSLKIDGYFTCSTYLRIFIPEIFKNFKKVAYFDVDGIFDADVKEFFDTDLKDSWIGAIRDTYMNYWLYSTKDTKSYLENVLKMKNPQNYFNSGVLLFNIPELLKNNFTDSCIKTIEKLNKTQRYIDQCIINSVSDEHVCLMDERWNAMYDPMKDIPWIKHFCSKEVYEKYMQSIENPKFHHFCGMLKPWKDPYMDGGEIFWKYARMSDFWEGIIYENPKYCIINKVDSSKFKQTFFEKIFSVKNHSRGTKIHKIITILGIKIKIKKRREK